MLRKFEVSEGRGWTQFSNLIGNSFYCRLLLFVTLQRNHSSAEHCSIYWYQGCLYKHKHSCCHICIDFIGSLHASAISKYTQFQSGSKNLSSIGNIWKAWKRKWILGSTSKCLTISKSMKCEMRFFSNTMPGGKGEGPHQPERWWRKENDIVMQECWRWSWKSHCESRVSREGAPRCLGMSDSYLRPFEKMYSSEGGHGKAVPYFPVPLQEKVSNVIKNPGSWKQKIWLVPRSSLDLSWALQVISPH